MSKLKDLTGKEFGYFKVLERAEDYISPNTGKRHTRWKCQCNYNGCTNIFITFTQQIYSNTTVSCPECAKMITASKKAKRNEYEFTSDTCIGYTSKGEIFTVDIEDYDLIKNHTWHYDKEGYVRATVRINGNRKNVMLSRLIMGVGENKEIEVDHIHGSQTLGDNRKSNLRICTHEENSYNKKKRKDSKQKYKGVYKRGNKYYVSISYKGKRIYLGLFENEEQAKEAYNNKAKELHGEFACFN